MLKWIGIIFGGVLFLAGIGSIASVDTGNVSNSYADATEEEKQRRLEVIAKGFKAGFKMTAGSRAEITQTYVDASADLVSFSVQLKDPRVNDVPYEHVERQRVMVLKQVCQQTQKKGLLETDFTMRVRFFKPAGGKLMTLQVDGENCAPYVS